MNIFQGEGVFLMCFVCVLLYNGILDGVGINPGRQTMYHMCKTWLQKVHGGWNMEGDLEIKNIQNKFIFFVLFHVKDVKDTLYGM